MDTAAGSRVLAGNRARRDAAAVQGLRDAGAVILGKTHTHEFAFGLVTPASRNPHALGRITGGSSGGSAAALASHSVAGALGTDTGGSIRVPSSLCGVVGLKPTYGLVPTQGVTPLSWSLDHVGPMARTVTDAALILDAIAGPGAVGAAGEAGGAGAAGGYGRHIGKSVRGLRVGVPSNYYFDHVDPEVEAAVRTAVDGLAHLGAEVRAVEIPLADQIHPTQWGLMVPEASAYHQENLRTSAHLYGEDVRILLEAGDMFLATDYIRAQRVRTLIRQAWQGLFDGVDVLIAPATPATAAERGQQEFTWADGSAESVSDAYVRLNAAANLTGMPAISVPAGMGSLRLPIGIQLMGAPHSEATLLQAAAVIEGMQAGGGPRPAALSLSR